MLSKQCPKSSKYAKKFQTSIKKSSYHALKQQLRQNTSVKENISKVSMLNWWQIWKTCVMIDLEIRRNHTSKFQKWLVIKQMGLMWVQRNVWRWSRQIRLDSDFQYTIDLCVWSINMNSMLMDKSKIVWPCLKAKNLYKLKPVWKI